MVYSCYSGIEELGEIVKLQIIYKQTSVNHEITVVDTDKLYGEKGKFRALQFSNGDVQGAVDLEHPDRIVLEYPRAIIHLMKANHMDFEDVFVIGHGIGTIAGYFAEKRFKIAEIDNGVVEISRNYFGYQSPNVLVGDGRCLLEGEESNTYDYIILDAFTNAGTPKHLISMEFFAAAADKLNVKGSLIINMIGKSENDAFMNAIYTTLGEVYPYIQPFSLPAEDIKDTQNILFMASHKPIRFQGRHMAGFKATQMGQGYIIID